MAVKGGVVIEAAPQNRKVFIDLGNMHKAIKIGIHDSLFEVDRENIKHIRSLMLERKTGRIYKIKGKDHQASAPFTEAPAILSGDLLRSVDYVVRGSSQVEFGDNFLKGKEPIGLFLEDGTKNDDGSVKMQKRPHVRRTVTEKYKDNFNTLESYVKRALKV